MSENDDNRRRRREPPCLESEVRGRFVPPHLRERASDATLRSYRRLLERARSSPDAHLARLTRLCASDDDDGPPLARGRASQDAYGALIRARAFDRYGRVVKREIARETEEPTSPRTAPRRPRRRAEDEHGDDGIDDRDHDENDDVVVEKLTTPAWRIGFAPVEHGPPGLAPPLRGVSNSKGNERFFSYDGQWREGNLEGEGTYRFLDANGSTHAGVFRRNVPDGRGTASYPGGTVHVGNWCKGYPHGEGRTVYRGGAVYEGRWNEGRRHGRGVLTYPNGSYYEGDFRRGRFHGRGTFVSVGSGLRYEGEFHRGCVAGAGTFTFPNGRRCRKEWPRSCPSRRRSRPGGGGDGEGTGITVHRALEYVEKEWSDKVRNEKRLWKDLHSVARQEKTDAQVRRAREAVKEERSAQKNREIMKKRETVRKMTSSSKQKHADELSNGAE